MALLIDIRFSGGGIYLICAEFDFYCEPLTVRIFYNGINLLAGIVLIVIQHTIVYIGIYPQVTLTQRLKHKAGAFKIAKQPFGSSAKQCTRKRRVDKMPLYRLFYPNRERIFDENGN